MKITVNQLRRVIAEETKKLVREMHEDEELHGSGLNRAEYDFAAKAEGFTEGSDDEMTLDLGKVEHLISSNVKGFVGCLKKGVLVATPGSDIVEFHFDSGGHPFD